MNKNVSTEDKIKEAARKVFLEKGYGQTRTRDIADEAGINLALLNYYFRSKDKLFDIIMEESMQEMFSIIKNIINDETTSLSKKIDLAVERYTDLLLANPNLPIFVLSEMQANPTQLINKAGASENMIIESLFIKQLQEQITKVKLNISPLHIFFNLISMSIFPIVAKPMLMSLYSEMTNEMHADFIDERRKLIPIWIKNMLKMEE